MAGIDLFSFARIDRYLIGVSSSSTAARLRRACMSGWISAAQRDVGGAESLQDSLVALNEMLPSISLEFSPYFLHSRPPNNTMAEPFGIASLSIEACKALVSYCDGWRAFDTEVESVKIKAEGLLSTLRILDKLLRGTRAINLDVATDITLKISQTETSLTKVNNQVAKYSVIQKSSGADQKIRETAKKAKYPFRRDTLKSVANDLQDIQINLNTALLA